MIRRPVFSHAHERGVNLDGAAGLMEKRAIIAALLMAGLLILYQSFFAHTPEPPPPAPKAEVPAAKPAAPSTTSPVTPSPAAAAPAPIPVAAVPLKTVEVTGPLYKAEVSSHGGDLSRWDLDYRGVKPMIVPGLLGPRGITVERAGQPPLVVDFTVTAQSLDVSKMAGRGEITFVGEDGFGLRIMETLRFRANDYDVERTVRVENRGRAPQEATIAIMWGAPVTWPKDVTEKFQGQHPTRVVRYANGSVRHEELAKMVDFVGDGQWIGLESEWYLSALVAQTPGFRLAEGKAGDAAHAGVRVALPTLQPGQSWDGKVLIYVGPKEYYRLKALGFGLEKSIYFGGFPFPQSYGGLPMEWIAVPILWLLGWFYRYTHNYGVAIILLTVLTKVIFFPLTLKSMRSMKAMQALQPQINALRSKYKSDPQRIQRETMELYREHRVNPLGGCLPMIVQIPVFYALYVALSVSVEMQNAPFICFGHLFGMHLWICDLAASDPTYILPILMGVSMFVQQKMTPTMGDPRQAKMMLLMPVVFTFMFLNLPSGLVLYWTLSNVLQIAQQMYMERSHSPAKPLARAAKNAAKKA
jgi:YidC/Oxa1 family membrane protein insertase